MSCELELGTHAKGSESSSLLWPSSGPVRLSAVNNAAEPSSSPLIKPKGRCPSKCVGIGDRCLGWGSASSWSSHSSSPSDIVTLGSWNRCPVSHCGATWLCAFASSTWYTSSCGAILSIPTSIHPTSSSSQSSPMSASFSADEGSAECAPETCCASCSWQSVSAIASSSTSSCGLTGVADSSCASQRSRAESCVGSPALGSRDFIVVTARSRCAFCGDRFSCPTLATLGFQEMVFVHTHTAQTQT